MQTSRLALVVAFILGVSTPVSASWVYSISGSDSDPFVHTGIPVEVLQVYLWLVEAPSPGGGAIYLDLVVEGGVPLAFAPLTEWHYLGTLPHLSLTYDSFPHGDCPPLPSLVGAMLLLDQSPPGPALTADGLRVSLIPSTIVQAFSYDCAGNGWCGFPDYFGYATDGSPPPIVLGSDQEICQPTATELDSWGVLKSLYR